MTLPSAILDAMASTLDLRLGEAAKEVRIHDGALGEDPKNTVLAGKDPLVLVTCLGANLQPDGYGVADAVWAAFAIAREGATSGSKKITRGSVAGNLAFLISGIVESEKWNGLMVARAQRIRVANEYTEKQSRETQWGIWSCAWTQPFEVKPEDVTEYGRLGSIHYTFAMGDEHTPDALATIVFPEPTP